MTEPCFLSIDHIDGKGAQHKREVIKERSSYAVYKWLKDHGFPKDNFRLLCHNCNQARGAYGHCPHEVRVSAASASSEL